MARSSDKPSTDNETAQLMPNSPPLPKKQSIKGALAAGSAAMVMAGYLVLGKRFVSAPEDMGGDVGAFLLLRQLMASLLLILVTVASHGFVLPNKEHQGQLHLLGIMNFINAVGFVWGFKLTTAFITSVMQLCIPVMTMLYSFAAGVEAPSVLKVVGLLTVVAGCLLVTTSTSASEGDTHDATHASTPAWQFYLGVGIITAQCMSFVGLVIVQEKVMRHYSVPVVVCWSYCLCTLWSVLYSLCDGSFLRLHHHLTSVSSMAIITYSATAGAVIYFQLIGYATKHLSPTLVSLSVALEPLAVSAIGAVAYGDALRPLDFLGYFLAAAGVITITFSYQQQETEKAAVLPSDHGNYSIINEEISTSEYSEEQQ